MTANQLFRQSETLKKAVSESSFGSNEGWVNRQKLEDLYQKLLVADLEYALDKKVEQDLWNYVFKNQITVMQQQTKEKGDGASGKADVLAGLNLFLETASGFYLQLLQELCSIFRLDLPFRKRAAYYGIIKEVVNTKNMKIPTKASRLYICQYCLVHLGDIARYRQQIDQAQTYYRHAVFLVPYNGQPYNQLAILEASKGHKLASVFYYVRSLLVRNPFPVAAMNLEKFYYKITKEPLELKGKLSMNEILQAFLQFHGLIYLLQDLNKAEKLKDRLLSSLPAHITSMSFSSHQFIQIIVINLGAMHQANRPRENRDEFAQQRAHQLVMQLNVLLMESLIAGTPKQRVREYHTLAAIKILLDWVRHTPCVIDNQTLKSSTVWPSMCKLLNNLQYIAQQKNVRTSPTELEKTPLPEDYDVQCFQPLDGCYRQLEFLWPHPDCLSTESESRLRCERIVQHGVWLAQRLPDIITAHKQKNGAYVFSVQSKPTPAPPTQPAKTNQSSQPAPVKMMLNSEEEYPALIDKRNSRQNVALQSLMNKKPQSCSPSEIDVAAGLPTSFAGVAPANVTPVTPRSVLQPQRLQQASMKSSTAVLTSSAQIVTSSTSLTQSSSAQDLKPGSGILKIPSQDFDQQSNNSVHKPSVHFRIDAMSEDVSPDRESPQELLSQPGVLKLPSRQLWPPDSPQIRPQAWTTPIFDVAPTEKPVGVPMGVGVTLEAPAKLSPTQQAIARQLSPESVARQHSPPQLGVQSVGQLSPQQVSIQLANQKQQRARQMLAQKQMLSGQQGQDRFPGSAFPGQPQFPVPQQNLQMSNQQQQQQQRFPIHNFDRQRESMQLSQQQKELLSSMNRPLATQHQGLPLPRQPPPSNPLPGHPSQSLPVFRPSFQDSRNSMSSYYRAEAPSKHPLEGLGIQDPSWPSERPFTSYLGHSGPNWDIMAHGDRTGAHVQNSQNFRQAPRPNPTNFSAYNDPTSRSAPMVTSPFVNLDPRSGAVPGTSFASDQQVSAGPSMERAPPTAGAQVNPPPPGGVGGNVGTYSLFSQTPWSSASSHYDVMTTSSSPKPAPQPKSGSMYQPLWTSGPSPLEKLLEQQKQQRQHDPH